MTDYSELTDFEINKMVATALCIKPRKTLDVISYKETVHYPDYCNNWSDAGPIIVENGIGFSKLHPKRSGENINEWVVMINNPLSSRDFDKKYYSIFYNHENPLRAAMIVFLMMKEGEE